MVKTALFVIGAATALAACGSTAGTTTTTAPVAPATSSSGTIDATVAATPSGNQQLQAAVEAYSAVADGHTIVSAPIDGPFGRTFTFADPDGYQVTLHDRA
jgi:predicted enzyme related to lactoylglutathione lyase